MCEQNSPFTVADLTEPRAKPDPSGFCYTVRYLPRIDPQETCWPVVEFASCITGTTRTVGEAVERMTEHVIRLAVDFAIVEASVHANNFLTTRDGMAQRLAR